MDDDDDVDEYWSINMHIDQYETCRSYVYAIIYSICCFSKKPFSCSSLPSL